MNCPKCERELVQYARFCGYCGERLVVTCPSCQVLNPPDGRFCYNCGVGLTEADSRIESPGPVSDEREQPQVAAIRCPRCETVNEPGSKYCYKCGLPLEEEVVRRPQQSVTLDSGSLTNSRPLDRRVALESYWSVKKRADGAVLLSGTQCLAIGLDILHDLAWFPEAWSVLTFVGLLIWAYGASRNLEVLGALGQRFSPGWVVGWWFIPIFNLFRPYQVVAEIWRGSDPEMVGEPVNWKRGPTSALLGWWWVLFLMSVYTWLARWADEPDTDTLVFRLLTGTPLVGAAVLAMLVVRRVTAMQKKKYRKMMASTEQ